MGFFLFVFFNVKPKKKNFQSTNDPTVVRVDDDKLVELPKTKTEGQLTADKVVSVVVEEAKVVEPTKEESHVQENVVAVDPAPGTSAGDLLFGPRPSKSTRKG